MTTYHLTDAAGFSQPLKKLYRIKKKHGLGSIAFSSF